MIAVQKRSGKRHIVHPDGWTTMCGRGVYKRSYWRLVAGDNAGCEICRRMSMARAQAK